MSTPLGPAGWHPDPLGRYEYRYFNGHEWTADVSGRGERFVDPAGVEATATTPPKSGHGLATAAFVIGLVSLLGAWIPFVFVLAAAGAITSIALGVAALKKPQPGFAIAGIVLSIAALLTCIAGFAFTRLVVREVEAYLQPGPHTPTITTCKIVDGAMSFAGTWRNDDSVVHDYTVVIEYVVAGSTKGTDDIIVKTLAPNEVTPLTSNAIVIASGNATCKLSVYGPTPFGVPQKSLGTP